jgi:type III pantothenate kinase
MLLAIDVGNTNITLGRFEDGELVDTNRIATSVEAIWALDLTDTSEAVVASVVPEVTSAVVERCAKHDIPLLVADWQTIPMPVEVERPDQVGADRLVNAFAAARLYGQPAIVVDLGTATTFDVVDANGAFVGGAIAPGIRLGAAALASRTALLPRIELELPDRAIGRNTVEALQAGIVLGHRHLVEGLVTDIRGIIGVDAVVLLTGGYAAREDSPFRFLWQHEPDLTLNGIRLIHELNSV